MCPEADPLPGPIPAGGRSARCAPLEDLEVLIQPVVGLGGALLHPRLEHPVPVLDRVEGSDGCERGLAVVLLEPHGLNGDVSGQALPLERPNDPLRANDLTELAAESMLLAV